LLPNDDDPWCKDGKCLNHCTLRTSEVDKATHSLTTLPSKQVTPFQLQGSPSREFQPAMAACGSSSTLDWNLSSAHPAHATSNANRVSVQAQPPKLNTGGAPPVHTFKVDCRAAIQGEVNRQRDERYPPRTEAIHSVHPPLARDETARRRHVIFFASLGRMVRDSEARGNHCDCRCCSDASSSLARQPHAPCAPASKRKRQETAQRR
jgi:hypothetical protein